MQKIYIAGKIGGLTEEEYTKNFEEAEKYIDSKLFQYISVSPLRLPHNHDRSWQSYMKEDIAALVKCDTVFALRNWRESPGATIEINLAISLGIDVIFQK